MMTQIRIRYYNTPKNFFIIDWGILLMNRLWMKFEIMFDEDDDTEI